MPHFMKEFFKIAWRFLRPYKHLLGLNFVFNLLSALFAVFSIALIIPILQIIFQMESKVYEFQANAVSLFPFQFDVSALQNNLYYYITLYKDEYGPGWALLFVGVFLVLATFLKVGTTFLASYTSVGLRNGVVRDLRRLLYDRSEERRVGKECRSWCVADR